MQATQKTETRKPLARTTMTIADPDGGDAAITVEVIVVKQNGATAQERDLPELAEAGWDSHEAGGLTIHVRTVGP